MHTKKFFLPVIKVRVVSLFFTLLLLDFSLVQAEKYQQLGDNRERSVDDLQTELLTASSDAPKRLPWPVKKCAALNKYLNNSIYFDTSFLKNPKAVRKYHLKKKAPKSEVGHIVTVETKDGYRIPCTYFNRNSDRLIIIAGGFTDVREYMSPFISMFDTSDVVIFDFRGHGIDDDSIFNVGKLMFGVNTNYSTLGRKEELDVFAVVDFFKTSNPFRMKRKQYQEVVGLSLCYGAFIFLKAQGMRPDLFDKLIIDSCWNSLHKIVKKFKENPLLLCNVQRANNYKLLKVLRFKVLQRFLVFLVTKVWGSALESNLLLTDYLKNIHQTPILLFYGKNDVIVDREEFEAIWQAIQHNKKLAVITSNAHVKNHLKQKELYKLFCDLFFNFSISDIENIIYDQEKLINYYCDQVRARLKSKN